jgi:O-acetyl-ADP-ribose deacetylase (regulator of RNase III)
MDPRVDDIYARDWKHPDDQIREWRHKSRKCAEVLIPHSVPSNMAKFKALIGDMFASNAQTLVNTVNCVGVMGKGVALKFKQRFPEMFNDYARRCEQKAVKLGEPYVYEDKSGVKILNLPTKDHWRSPSRLHDIERGLDHLVQNVQAWNITSMAMPPLGCGNGGLEWSQVGPLIYRKLHGLPVDIEVYAPYGTLTTALTTEFLAAPSQMPLDEKGRSFGPFSADVKPALHEFANRNWVQEATLGRMLALRVGEQFEKERNKFRSEIEQHRKTIDKTVDLFSRIKDTEQAEEVLTVLFASRQVKKGDRAREIEEQQIYDYILDWKKAWNRPEKKEAVANAIRNLALLGWIRVRASESMMAFA